MPDKLYIEACCFGENAQSKAIIQNTLPKSGGWLNSVKVVLGFLEFAFAFKFLSIADMVLNLHIPEREVFISVRIAVFLGLALYLWGKIQFPHDSSTTYLPVSRFVLGTIVFAFVIYMIPGLWGAPVKLISGFPHPVDYAENEEEQELLDGYGYNPDPRKFANWLKKGLEKSTE